MSATLRRLESRGEAGLRRLHLSDQQLREMYERLRQRGQQLREKMGMGRQRRRSTSRKGRKGRKGMRGGNGSAYVGQWYAPSVTNVQGLSQYELERIDNSPMFHPLSTDTTVATPTSGELVTGAFLAATKGLPDDTPPIATVATVQNDLAGSGRGRRRKSKPVRRRRSGSRQRGSSRCRGRVSKPGRRRGSKSGYKRKLSCVRKK